VAINRAATSSGEQPRPLARLHPGAKGHPEIPRHVDGSFTGLSLSLVDPDRTVVYVRGTQSEHIFWPQARVPLDLVVDGGLGFCQLDKLDTSCHTARKLNQDSA